MQCNCILWTYCCVQKWRINPTCLTGDIYYHLCISNLIIKSLQSVLLGYSSWGLVHDIVFYLIFSNSDVYIKYYMNMGRTVALGLIPFSALIFFNIRIYLRFMLTRGRFQGQGAAGNSQVRSLISYYMKLIVFR